VPAGPEVRGLRLERGGRRAPPRGRAGGKEVGGRYDTDQLVPAIAVQGLFTAKNIEAAQPPPLVIFWGHCLDELTRRLPFSGQFGSRD